MSFGIYVHIPYCIQRCPYCDFATYEQSQIPEPSNYFQLLSDEIRLKAPFVPFRQVDTIYFGGGTPSLIPSKYIVAIKNELSNAGFVFTDQLEATIEINPATLDHNKMDEYFNAGINRFSVGAQTFNDNLLKQIGRKHSSKDTIETLNLLKERKASYSFDLLFALPGQTIDDLKRDLELVSKFSPNHVSAYCLTVPESNPLSKGRAPEEEQILMFNLILDHLSTLGLQQYEISNFALPGFESRHNLLYWEDQPYWGIGLSAHSYFKGERPLCGSRPGTVQRTRFWGPSTYVEYSDYVSALKQSSLNNQLTNAWNSQHPELFETLAPHQALTDICHVSLRLARGLHIPSLARQFGETAADQVTGLLHELSGKNLVTKSESSWRLTKEGWLLSNQVFAKLTFLKEDLPTLSSR